MECGQC